MYENDFFIPCGKGNNIFGYSQNLRVNAIKIISNIHEVKIGNSVSFAHTDDTGVMREFFGLENIYHISLGKKQIPIYIFDNHNHAYFFWHQEKHKRNIHNGCTLYHIDEHADTRIPEEFLAKEQLQSLEDIFRYTNFTLNIGNYIIPAQYDGLIDKIIQIRSESALQEILSSSYSIDENCILNIDLDFFQPELDYIDMHMKTSVIQKILPYAACITIASSPFFIDQKLALEKLAYIFSSVELNIDKI